jgi:alpha-N-acetylglucosaminidase
MKRFYFYAITLLVITTLHSCNHELRRSSNEFPSLHLLLSRISPNLEKKVIFEEIEAIGCESVFELESKDARLIVRGNNYSSMTAGLSWYLKYYCNSGTYWGDYRNPVPEDLPVLEGKIRKESPYKYRYYMNMTVDRYSTRYWKWDRWEREIDWMALNGINIALVRVGESGVIRNVLAHFGIEEQDEEKNTLINERIELQQKIIDRMRELGIHPLLNGYTGYVPRAIKETVKTAQFVDGGMWLVVPKNPFIKLEDPFFNEYGKVFYGEQKKLYGDQTFIGADPVVEGSDPEGASFSDLGKKVQDIILEAYPDCTWVLQGWQVNPRPELLEKADKERVLILDLWGEVNPQWKRVDIYKQTPWIWNVLNNFGGNTGMYGNLEMIFNQPREARREEQGRMLRGLGTTLEAIENNPVVYHAVFESAWLEESPDIDEWLKGYARSRYGSGSEYAEKAWAVLNRTAYNATSHQEGPSENLMCARPGLNLKSVTTWGTSVLYYSPDSLLPAWDNMIKAAPELGHNKDFQYDLVDLTRQVISNFAYVLYPQIIDAYRKNETKKFEELSTRYLGLFDDMNDVLKTQKEFLTGPWIEDARSWGRDQHQKAENEKEVKMLITTWGARELSEDGKLRDYAFREWEGIMTDLYKKRWETYFGLLSSSADREKEPDIDWFDFDYSWITNGKQYSTEPSGDPVKACVAVYAKYRNI